MDWNWPKTLLCAREVVGLVQEMYLNGSEPKLGNLCP